MKKFLLFFVVIITCVIFTQHVHANAVYQYVNVQDGVKLRADPTPEAAAQTVLFEGARVLKEYTEGEWSYVTFKGYKGWIKSEFLTTYTYEENRFEYYLTLLENEKNDGLVYGLLQDFNKDGKEELFLVKDYTRSPDYQYSQFNDFSYALYDGEELASSGDAIGGLYLIDFYDYKQIAFYEFMNNGTHLEGVSDANVMVIQVLTPIERSFTINTYSLEAIQFDNGDWDYTYKLNDKKLAEKDKYIFDEKYKSYEQTPGDFIYIPDVPYGVLNTQFEFDYTQLYTEIETLKFANDALLQESSEQSDVVFVEEEQVAQSETLVEAPITYDEQATDENSGQLVKAILGGIIVITLATVIYVFIRFNRRLKI